MTKPVATSNASIEEEGLVNYGSVQGGGGGGHTTGGHGDSSHHYQVKDEHRHLLHHQPSSILRLEEDVPFYAPPQQRQKWDDPQILPHVNWGDLFLDLFYVSGAFNLASSLKESLTIMGLVYFVACYLSILNIWMEKLGYDARFVADDNLFHRSLELCQFIFIGTAIANIKPVQVMSDTHNRIETLLFCSSLVVLFFFYLIRQLDVYFNVHGGRSESKEQAKQEIFIRTSAFLFCYLPAAVWASYDFFFDSSLSVETTIQQARVHENNQEIATNHGPILLCLAGWFVIVTTTQLWRFVYVPALGVSHKTLYVPVNVEFWCHRLGEWTMLMLGESVLALLIVEQSSGIRYYVTLYSGIVTVALFQYLYFRSHPLDPDDHAMRRSSSGGYIFYYGQVFYSANLIMIGCSYKMILHYYLEEEEELEFQRDEDLERRIAKLYSWSTALSFVALDVMLISHRGWKAHFSRLRNHGKCGIIPTLILVVDFTLLSFIAFLPRLMPHLPLESLVAIGLVVVAMQVLLRTRGLRHFPVSKNTMQKMGLLMDP